MPATHSCRYRTRIVWQRRESKIYVGTVCDRATLLTSVNAHKGVRSVAAGIIYSFTMLQAKSNIHQSPPETAGTNEKKRVANHHTNGRRGSILLMMCQVIIWGPDGSTAQARPLFDSGSEASFITDRMAQQLHLPHCRQGPTVTNIGRSIPQIWSKGLVNIQTMDTSQTSKVHCIEALVLPKITLNTPAYPVSMQQKRKHLTGFSLADPEYGTTGAPKSPMQQPSQPSTTANTTIHNSHHNHPQQPSQPSTTAITTIHKQPS